MLNFALNHMSVPAIGYDGLLDMALRLDFAGVEFRNDFSHRQLFDGDEPHQVFARAQENKMNILGLSEVKAFNYWDDSKATEAHNLISTAALVGASSVSLIPANDGRRLGQKERLADLEFALRGVRPILEQYDMIGLIEPLGFETCALRYKSEIIDTIERLNAQNHFALVHDSFHHVIAGEKEIHPEFTKIVHISGVIDTAPAVTEFSDTHRVLVSEGDRLDNVGQIQKFYNSGWNGPFSFEAFSPEAHALTDPEAALRASAEFIQSQVSLLTK